jgi:hypothetical protein
MCMRLKAIVAFGSHSVLQRSHNVYLIGNEFTSSFTVKCVSYESLISQLDVGSQVKLHVTNKPL